MAAYADQTVRSKGAANLMKRAHKRSHLILWIVLGPSIAAVLLLAVLNRPAEPVNETLPAALIEEAQ